MIQSDLFGMVKWPFKGLSDLQLGGKKGTLNHLVHVFFVMRSLPAFSVKNSVPSRWITKNIFDPDKIFQNSLDSLGYDAWKKCTKNRESQMLVRWWCIYHGTIRTKSPTKTHPSLVMESARRFRTLCRFEKSSPETPVIVIIEHIAAGWFKLTFLCPHWRSLNQVT